MVETPSTLSALNMEKWFYQEFLNVLLTMSLSGFEVTSGLQGVENGFSILQRPKLSLSLFKAQLKSF